MFTTEHVDKTFVVMADKKSKKSSKNFVWHHHTKRLARDENNFIYKGGLYSFSGVWFTFCPSGQQCEKLPSFVICSDSHSDPPNTFQLVSIMV